MDKKSNNSTRSRKSNAPNPAEANPNPNPNGGMMAELKGTAKEKMEAAVAKVQDAISGGEINWKVALIAIMICVVAIFLAFYFREDISEYIGEDTINQAADMGKDWIKNKIGNKILEN